MTLPLPPDSRDSSPPRGLIWAIAAAATVLHLATATRYGIFRDELYYLACAKHLAWGYVDHPPLIAFITWTVTHTLGTSLTALRLLPALASGALVLLTAGIAREFSGGRFAQGFAALAVAFVPIYLLLNHWLTMNAFEPLIWTGVLWCLLRAINSGDERYWLAGGALLGIGMENKYSIALLAAGIFLGLVLTPERRWLRSRWLWAGVALAGLLVLPNLLWLLHHDFPFLEFERNSRASGSRIERGPLAFIADQMLIMNPVLAPIWLGGCFWLFRDAAARRYRMFGWAFVLVFAVLLALKSKNYYLSPIYPILLAAGAIALERCTQSGLRWIRPTYIATLLLSACALAPLVMPILPIPAFREYQQALGGLKIITFEALPADELPQYFADEFGWEDMVRETAAAYNSLPIDERSQTAIFANNFGEAGAIDFFGPQYGLPPAISNHETYWLWGPQHYTGSQVIVLGSDGKGDREHFRSVQVVAHVGHPYSRDVEHFDLYLCRDLNSNLQDLWPGMKRW